MKSNFYVYIHVKPNDGEIFYVGKGKGYRVYSKHGRNKFWKNIVNKYGLDIFILENNLTEEEAFELEEKYIESIGRRDLNTGTLVNMTNGGEGMMGRKLSEEHRQKISETLTGHRHPEETRQKISKARTGRKLSEEHKCKISEAAKKRSTSEEYRRKLSEAAKKRNTEEYRRKQSEALKKYWADRKAKEME